MASCCMSSVYQEFVSAVIMDLRNDVPYHIHRLDLRCASRLTLTVEFVVMLELTLHLVLLFSSHICKGWEAVSRWASKI